MFVIILSNNMKIKLFLKLIMDYYIGEKIFQSFRFHCYDH